MYCTPAVVKANFANLNSQLIFTESRPSAQGSQQCGLWARQDVYNLTLTSEEAVSEEESRDCSSYMLAKGGRMPLVPLSFSVH